jgi:four helix bundle protein
MNKNLQQNGNIVTGMWLPQESLIVYQMALKFHVAAMTLLPKRGYPNLRDQLERASLSIVLNIAEGAGRNSPADRRKFFTIAMGSLLESSAILEVLRLRRIADPTRCRNGRLYLIHLARMLTRLAGQER